MKSITFIAAAAAVATVSAQSAGADEGRLFYSSPISSTVWTAGQNETVSWTNVCKPENKAPLNIVLYLGTGGKNGTEQVQVPNILPIGTLNCLTSKTATVFLPANLTTSDKYAIHVDTEPLQSYSASFTIKGVAPPAAAVPTTGAPAPVTSSAGPASPSQTSAVPAGGKTGNGAGSLKVVGSTVAVVAAAFGALLL
ncbi:hypothetical protein BG006_008431 [Podila minutissima]|uniref:Uncharacterized protein n=1 Tax=Podila minutissima TaxID=64525 RepID=A0A9P5VQA1_9FUNG|nr:hypothetical protein BG006_008431 [Podila minutissima]